MTEEKIAMQNTNAVSGYLNRLQQDVQLHGYETNIIHLFFDQIKHTDSIASVIQTETVRFAIDPSLENLYLLGALTDHFQLSHATYTTIVKHVLSSLQEQYASALSSTEYSINTRLAGWYVLKSITPFVDPPVKQDIDALLAKAHAMEEDTFVKGQLASFLLERTNETNP